MLEEKQQLNQGNEGRGFYTINVGEDIVIGQKTHTSFVEFVGSLKNKRI
jgi:hypothetical protein